MYNCSTPVSILVSLNSSAFLYRKHSPAFLYRKHKEKRAARHRSIVEFSLFRAARQSSSTAEVGNLRPACISIRPSSEFCSGAERAFLYGCIAQGHESFLVSSKVPIRTTWFRTTEETCREGHSLAKVWILFYLRFFA